jgi:hypothetical protein
MASPYVFRSQVNTNLILDNYIFSYLIFISLICGGDPHRPPSAVWSFSQNETVGVTECFLAEPQFDTY